MVKSENFFTEQEATRKINQLRDMGKRFIVEDMIDYGDICEGVTTAYTQISWEE